MALNFFLKRSGTASKRPDATNMSLGEIDLNYDSATGGLFYKDSAGGVVKVGPAEVGSTAPNSAPAGSTGNSVGEFWYDTDASLLKIWDGTSWITTADTAAYLPLIGGTMTGDIAFSSSGFGINFGDASVLRAISNSTSTTSSTTAASSTAVKSAYDLANAAIPKSAYTACGDLLYGTGSNTYSALAVGSSGYVLTVSGGVPVWAAPTGGINSITGSAPIEVTAGANPVISACAASTLTPGVVQLNDTVSSSSVTEALTANQGLNLQTQIDALTVATNLTFAGTFNASTNKMVTVSSAGTAAGFSIGNNLPVPVVGNLDYFVIISTGGSYNPPGGGGPFVTSQGDWLLSDGSVWQFLNVGLDLPTATPTSAGAVLGRSNATQTALGCNALLASPAGAGNIGVGINAGCAISSGINNTTVGACAGAAATTGCFGVLIGASAGCSLTTSNGNTFIGTSAGCLATGTSNTAIGLNAGCGITTGSCNVALGNFAQVASATGSCQLAIGFSATDNWLTGDSSKNIQPGAGIKDCAGSVGTAGQILKSTGTAIQWSSVGASSSGIVNAAVEVCMDNFGVSMAGAGNRGFGIRALSGSFTASWTNWGFQGPSGLAAVATCNGCSVTTTFQRFDSTYNWTTVTGVQCTILTVGSPVNATYAIMGVVGNLYNTNTICITRVA